VSDAMNTDERLRIKGLSTDVRMLASAKLLMTHI